MSLLREEYLTTSKLLKAFIPITRFNKGEAGKIIEEVKADGIRVIVKNNIPECVMISVEEYNALTIAANRKIDLIQNKEEETKRKAFIEKIRKNVHPPLPPQVDRKTLMDSIGPIDVDEEAVNELRRISKL